MDFNVKKLAADAGTFLSRAVQVRPGCSPLRGPRRDCASPPRPQLREVGEAAGWLRGAAAAGPDAGRWPGSSAPPRAGGAAAERGRAGGWARRGLPALREQEARPRWRVVSPDLRPGRAAMCCCEVAPWPRGSPASSGLGGTRGFRPGWLQNSWASGGCRGGG